MKRFKLTFTFVIFVGMSLMSGCGVRDGPKGQEGTIGNARDSSIDDQSEHPGTEPVTSPVILSEIVRITPLEAGN